jgi:hypothetical protein
VNWLDQINWQLSRLSRRVAEALEYFLTQLLNSPRQETQASVPDWLEPLARGLMLLLAIVLLLLLARLLQSLWQRWRGKRRQAGTGLPLLRTRPQRVQDWLERARQYQAEGDYANGCRALYMALLIHLDAGGWLRQDQARTDREYLRSLESLWALGQRPSHLRQSFYDIFQTHEQLCYADQEIAAAAFERCQSAYFELEPELVNQPD